jgi:DNA (cytosine-5)-methyltransferase 1
MRPRALDLFCGAGGASMGLHRAGFDVTGVDIRPQPRYPFKFVRSDALDPLVDLGKFDFIWASPPCQHWSSGTMPNRRKLHLDLIPQTRAMLAGRRTKTCIENVPRAPLIDPLVLTGAMFGLNTYRRRHFELNFACFEPISRGRRFGPLSRAGSVSVVGEPSNLICRRKADGTRASKGSITAWRSAMGIDWMRGPELTQAIPPCYAEFIGRAALFIDQLERAA